MKYVNRKRSIIGLFTFFFILGLLFIHFYAPRFITEINNPILNVLGQQHLLTQVPVFDDDTLKGSAFTFYSHDSLALSAYLSYGRTAKPKGTIILLHGIRSNKEQFIGLSNQLAAAGYNVAAMDLRAHGKSEGTHCTFGVKEKYDVQSMVSYLQNEGVQLPFLIWGQSLGGAIALQAMAIDKRIEAGIIESAFSDFTTITHDYFRYHAGFNIKSLTTYLTYRAGKVADFDPDDASPKKYAALIDQPVLLIHGTEDKRINIDFARENFKNLKSPDKKFIEVEGANHLNVWAVGGKEYFEKVMEFIEEQISK